MHQCTDRFTSYVLYYFGVFVRLSYVSTYKNRVVSTFSGGTYQRCGASRIWIGFACGCAIGRHFDAFCLWSELIQRVNVHHDLLIFAEIRLQTI